MLSGAASPHLFCVGVVQPALPIWACAYVCPSTRQKHWDTHPPGHPQPQAPAHSQDWGAWSPAGFASGPCPLPGAGRYGPAAPSRPPPSRCPLPSSALSARAEPATVSGGGVSSGQPFPWRAHGVPPGGALDSLRAGWVGGGSSLARMPSGLGHPACGAAMRVRGDHQSRCCPALDQLHLLVPPGPCSAAPSLREPLRAASWRPCTSAPAAGSQAPTSP